MANKQTTERLRSVIALFAKSSAAHITAQFVPPSPEAAAAATVAANWRRITKQCLPNGCIERVFDCRPLDDQLRATVITDSRDTAVLSVSIEGE